MTDNKQAPREVWVSLHEDWPHNGLWDTERPPAYLPGVTGHRYVRADVAAELARECLHTPWAPESTEYHSALMRIAELESEP